MTCDQSAAQKEDREEESIARHHCKYKFGALWGPKNIIGLSACKAGGAESHSGADGCKYTRRLNPHTERASMCKARVYNDDLWILLLSMCAARVGLWGLMAPGAQTQRGCHVTAGQSTGVKSDSAESESESETSADD